MSGDCNRRRIRILGSDDEPYIVCRACSTSSNAVFILRFHSARLSWRGFAGLLSNVYCGIYVSEVVTAFFPKGIRADESVAFRKIRWFKSKCCNI
jgi:hypothetical protein